MLISIHLIVTWRLQMTSLIFLGRFYWLVWVSIHNLAPQRVTRREGKKGRMLTLPALPGRCVVVSVTRDDTFGADTGATYADVETVVNVPID